MLLPSLPADARVWLFASARLLSHEEQEAVLAQAQLFLGTWTSHGMPVQGETELLYDCALAVGACIAQEELNAGVSGCGIDSLTHAVEAIAARLGFDWTEALEILYFGAEGAPQTVSRSEFRRRVKAGVVTPESFVLDLTSTSLGELRTNGIKRRVADTWLAGVFPMAQTVQASVE